MPRIEPDPLDRPRRGEAVNIYLSSSWKNRARVRALAIRLRQDGHEVYDFTDPACRNTPEIPPEAFPDEFDPERILYDQYLQAVPQWRAAVECNRRALDRCDCVVLMLPCGNDAHADWAYAVGKGKASIVCGQPRKGERTPSHMWCDRFVGFDVGVPDVVARIEARAEVKP